MFYINKHKHNKESNEEGQSLVIAALLMTLLVLFMSLVIDYGIAYNKRATFQTALDSTALASTNIGSTDFVDDSSGNKKLSFATKNSVRSSIESYMKQNGYTYEDDQVVYYSNARTFKDDCKKLTGNKIYFLVESQDSTDDVAGYVQITITGSFKSNYLFAGLIGSDAYNTICTATSKANYVASGNPNALKYQFLSCGGSNDHFNITGPIENTWLKKGLNWGIQGINGLLNGVWNDNNSWLRNLLGSPSKMTCEHCGKEAEFSKYEKVYVSENKVTYYKCPNCGYYCDVYGDEKNIENVAKADIVTSACIMNGHVHSNGTANIDVDSFRMSSVLAENIENATKDDDNDDSKIDPGTLGMATISVSTDTSGINISSENPVGKAVTLYDPDNATYHIKNVNGGNVDLTKGSFTQAELKIAKCWDFTREIGQLYYNSDTVSDPGLKKYIQKQYKNISPKSLTGSDKSDSNAAENVAIFAGDKSTSQGKDNDNNPVSTSDTTFSNVTFDTKNGGSYDTSSSSQYINPLTLLGEQKLSSNGKKVLPSVYDTFNNSFKLPTKLENIISEKTTIKSIVDDAENHVSTGVTVDNSDARARIHDVVYNDLEELGQEDDHSINNATDPTNRDSLREALPIGEDITRLIDVLSSNFSNEMAADYTAQKNTTIDTATPKTNGTNIKNSITSVSSSMYNDTYMSTKSYSTINGVTSSLNIPSSTNGYSYNKSTSSSKDLFLNDMNYYDKIYQPKDGALYVTNHFVIMRAGVTSYVTGNVTMSSDQTYDIDGSNGLQDTDSDAERIGVYMEGGTSTDPTTLFVKGNFYCDKLAAITARQYCDIVINGNLSTDDNGAVNIGDNSNLIVNGDIFRQKGTGLRLYVGNNCTVIVKGSATNIADFVVGNNSKVYVGGDILVNNNKFTIGNNSNVVCGGKITVNNGTAINVGDNSIVQAANGYDCSKYNFSASSKLISGGTIFSGSGNSNTFGNIDCNSNININSGNADFNGECIVRSDINVAGTTNINGKVICNSYIRGGGTINVSGKLSCLGYYYSSTETNAKFVSIYASGGMNVTGTVYSYYRLYSTGDLTFSGSAKVYCDSYTYNTVTDKSTRGDIIADGKTLNVRDSASVYTFGRVDNVDTTGSSLSNYRNGITAGYINMNGTGSIYTYGRVYANKGDMNIDNSAKIFTYSYGDILGTNTTDYAGYVYCAGRIELSNSSTADNPQNAGIYCQNLSTNFLIAQGKSDVYCDGYLITRGSGDNGSIYVYDCGQTSSTCPNISSNGYIQTNGGKFNITSFANLYCGGVIYCGDFYTSLNVNAYLYSISCGSAQINSSSIYYSGTFWCSGAVSLTGSSDTRYYANLNGEGSFTASSLNLGMYSNMYTTKDITVNGRVTVGASSANPENLQGDYVNGSLYCGGSLVCKSNFDNFGYVYVVGSNASSGYAVNVSGTLSQKVASKFVCAGSMQALKFYFETSGSLYCKGNMHATNSSTNLGIECQGSIDSNVTKSECYSRIYCGGNIVSDGSITILGLNDEDYSVLFAVGDITISTTGWLHISENSLTYAANYHLGTQNEDSDSTVRGVLYADYNLYGYNGQARVINIRIDNGAIISYENTNEVPITMLDGSIYLGGVKQDSSYDVKDLSKQKVRITVSDMVSVPRGYAVVVKKGMIRHETDSLSVNSDGNVLIQGTLIVDGDLYIDGYLKNEGTLIVKGNIHVNGRRGKAVVIAGVTTWGDYANEGVQNGWINPSSKGYIYCGGNFRSKFAFINLQGQVYIAGNFDCAFDHGAQQGSKYNNNSYEGSGNSALFVAQDFKCGSDGDEWAGDSVVRKNAILYCGGDVKTRRNFIVGDAWVENGSSEDGTKSDLPTKQYEYFQNTSYSGFNKLPTPAYKDSTEMAYGAKIVADSKAGDLPDNSYDVNAIWSNYIGTYKSKADLVGKYVVAVNVKQGYSVDDYGLAFIKGSLLSQGNPQGNNYIEAKGKSVIYVGGENLDAEEGSNNIVNHNNDYAMKATHFVFFPYSRVYCGGNMTNTGTKDTSINLWFNSWLYVNGDAVFTKKIKLRDGVQVVINGKMTSAQYIELGKAADGDDEAESDYLAPRYYIDGDVKSYAGYIKQYARSTLVSNGNVQAATYITLRHHSTLRSKGDVTALSGAFDGGSCSNIYVSGNLKTVSGPVKIRDACSTFIGGNLQSPTYIELGKHEDEAYKYYTSVAVSNSSNVPDYENPDNDEGDGSTNDSTVTAHETQCPYCGSYDVTQPDAEVDNYKCNNCNKEFSSSECYENDPAAGGKFYVKGNLKALTSYLRVYANSDVYTANSVSIYSYITLRHDAKLYVVSDAKNANGVDYSYNHDNYKLLDINASSVSDFYVDADTTSPGYNSIYYLQNGVKYYGFYLDTSKPNADTNSDGVIDRWLYQGSIYTYKKVTDATSGKINYEKFYGEPATEIITDNGGETKEYTKSFYYDNASSSIKAASSYNEFENNAEKVVDTAIMLGGESSNRVFSYYETVGNIFSVGDLTVGGNANLYATGNITSYGKTTIEKGAVIYAERNFKSACSLSISSLFSGANPCGFELNHGAVYAGRDIDIDSTAYMTGGVIEAGDDVSFDSIYSYYKYANNYSEGSNAYKNQAKNIDLIISAQGNNSCPNCESTDVSDKDGEGYCTCASCGRRFLYDYGNIDLSCLYNYGGGLTYAPNGNIKVKGVFYDYYGDMIATNVDVNSYYINMHRLANQKTLDLEWEGTGKSYLVK